MRVLVVHNRYRSNQPSGENQVVDDEIALLRDAGHDVALYQRESDEIAGFAALAKAALPARVVWSTSDRRRIRRLIASELPDVVHVHNTFPLISPSILGACRDAEVPVVVTLHNFRLVCANAFLFREGKPCELCVGSGPWSGVVHACYRGSRLSTLPVALSIQAHRSLGTWSRGVARFIALSRFARERLVAGGLPADRLVVKPNFVPDPLQQRASEGEFFLYLGRLSDEKGVDLLASAWSEALGKLIVVGDGPARTALERAFSRHGGSVMMTGGLPRSECMRLLLRARALVMPSRWYEGFPMVVPESYARGVPVIGPGHGSFPEIVEHERSGLLFRPGDAPSLADAMGSLLGPGVSEKMGRRARAIYEERYTAERNLDRLTQIYTEAIRPPLGDAVGPKVG
jgi:glycosyltransferase involved in cell wall biosynthesis